MTSDRAATLQDRFASAPMPTDSEISALKVAIHAVLVRCLDLLEARQLTAWEWQRFCDMSVGDEPEQAASWQWFLRQVVSRSVVTDTVREVIRTGCEGLVAAVTKPARLCALFFLTSTDSSHDPSILTYTLVSTFMRRVLERSGSRGEWSGDPFESTFRDLVEYVEADSDVFLCSSPLQRFAMNSDRLDIRRDLWIERLTWDERRRRLQDASVWGHVIGTFAPMWVAQERFALRYRVRLPRIRADDAIPMMIGRASEITDRVVLALRVHHPGPIGSDGRWLDDLTVRFDASEIGSAYGITMGFSDKYQLTIKESTGLDLLELLGLLENPSDDTGLAVAIRRFGFAYERRSNEDRIVDYWVALEALYTERGERGITARLAQRIPVISAPTGQERTILAAQVRELYDVRSNVVHGAAVAHGQLDAHAERSAGLVREAILSRLRGRWTPLELDSSGGSWSRLR